MKSRTSFFNGTAFRKNCTRFAPAWVLYTVLMLMLLLSLTGTDTGVRFASSLADMTPLSGAVSLVYALLNAQLLFGDLYNSRMCNALHAMPIRRESWFGTNVVTGLAFCTVPNAIFALIFLPLSGSVWEAPLLWLAVSWLQYVFFFGVAVLSAYCVGNRFAMALVYGILNFFSLILYWLVEKLYEPLLYGINISDEIFSLLCPAVQLIGSSYFSVEYDVTAAGSAVFREIVLAEGWLYLSVSAVLGLGAMAMALVLYRRRNLECAGDLMAVRRLGPVFLTLYTFCAGACCHGFFALFLGDDSGGFVILGLTIGFFTGLMLLHRTVRVIRKKNVFAFLGLLAVFAISLALTALDPLGITRWVPRAEQVRSVQIGTGGSSYSARDGMQLSAEEDVNKILQIHEQCLDQRVGEYSGMTVRIYLSYTLENGVTKQREYSMSAQTEAGAALESILSRPEAVLGGIYTDPQNYELVRAEFTDSGLVWEEEAELDALVEAIVRDCAAGRMAQDWAFMEDEEYTGWIYLETRQFNGLYYGRDIRFNSKCANIISWLEENSDFTMEDYIVYDGKYTAK